MLGHGPALRPHWGLRAGPQRFALPVIELPFPGVNHYILLYRFYFLTTYGMYDP